MLFRINLGVVRTVDNQTLKQQNLLFAARLQENMTS